MEHEHEWLWNIEDDEPPFVCYDDECDAFIDGVEVLDVLNDATVRAVINFVRAKYDDET